MNDTLLKSIEMLRQIRFASNIKMRRNFADFFSDRILQAATEKTLLKLTERLSVLVNASTGEMKRDVINEYISSAMKPESAQIVSWLREYPKLAAMLCFIKGVNQAKLELRQILYEKALKGDQSSIKEMLQFIEILDLG